MRFNVGDKVRVIGETHNWGKVKKGDIGIVTYRSEKGFGEELYTVDFKRQAGWNGFARCFEPIKKEKKVRVKKERKVMEEMQKDELCPICGEIVSITDGDYFSHNGEFYHEECFFENFFVCDECGEVFNINDANEANNGSYCQDCFEEIFVICCECGEVVDRDEVQEHDGDVYCQDCFDDNFTYCDCCGEHHLNDDMYECDFCGEVVCHDCINHNNGQSCCDGCMDYVMTCGDCGEWVHEDNAFYDEDEDEYFCPDCWHSGNHGVIHDYGFKPYPEFYGDATEQNGCFFGVELEVDKGRNARNVATEIQNYAGEVYMKYDGSLDCGFEIVSHPATFEYHMDSLNWKKIMQLCRTGGFLSHDSGTCGLHVHISKRGFGSTGEEQEMNISKLLYVFEKFWEEIKRFSRRNENQINHWARNYGLESTPTEIMDKARGRGRYYAVNLENRHTVELRIFRGTLNYNTFASTMQFCNLLVELVKSKDVKEIQALMWNDIVMSAKEYPELSEYLVRRNISNIRRSEEQADDDVISFDQAV